MANEKAFCTARMFFAKRNDEPWLKRFGEIGEVLKELNLLSDRGTAVLGFALLEEVIGRLVGHVMVKPKRNLAKGLRFLPSASARIEALYQFGVLPVVMFEELTLLRNIRNDFSHGAQAGLAFDSPKVISRTNHLRCLEITARTLKSRDVDQRLQHSVDRSKQSSRDIFIGSVGILLLLFEASLLTPGRRTTPILMAL